MKIFYNQVSTGNFGDDLNLWLWDQLFQQECFDNTGDEIFFGVGTLLSDRVLAWKGKKIIAGSGTTHPEINYIKDDSDIFWVRGPLTAKAMKLDSSKAITDPAYLILDTEFAKTKVSPEYDISFIPHHLSLPMLDWETVSRDAGMHFIDPTDQLLDVVNQIRKTKLIITESLHGAILADTFRIPWIAVNYAYRFDTFKWQDWSMSMNIDLQVTPLPAAFQGKLGTDIVLKNYLKSKLSKAFNRPEWSRRPYRNSSETEIAEFVDILKNIPSRTSPQLSDEQKLSEVMDLMRQQLSLFQGKYLQN